MPAIRIGYSADPDDAFMLCALMTGKVAVPGADIEYVADDVESLNRRARAAEPEGTAVSAATYALVADRYRLLDCGAAMADGPGPVVVAREPIARGDIPDRVVAIPRRPRNASCPAHCATRSSGRGPTSTRLWPSPCGMHAAWTPTHAVGSCLSTSTTTR